MPPYQQLKLKITPKQQKDAIKGRSVRLTPSCIGEGQLVMLHPVNYKRLMNAKSGVNLSLSPGEMVSTAEHHGMITGAGFFGDLWEGIKSAGKWLKDSGVGSSLADIAQTVASPFVGEQVASIGRKLLKSTTGVGIKKGRKPKGTGLYL